MAELAKYLLRGGPRDGELVDPPPTVLHAVADALADGFGVARNPNGAFISGEGWVYEFSPTEAGVLVGRLATDEELLVQKAYASFETEQTSRERMIELSPHVVAALKQADRLLDGNECVAASRGDVAIFVARGATAAAWKQALYDLGPEHACSPEEIPDQVWDTL